MEEEEHGQDRLREIKAGLIENRGLGMKEDTLKTGGVHAKTKVDNR